MIGLSAARTVVNTLLRGINYLDTRHGLYTLPHVQSRPARSCEKHLHAVDVLKFRILPCCSWRWTSPQRTHLFHTIRKGSAEPVLCLAAHAKQSHTSGTSPSPQLLPLPTAHIYKLQATTPYTKDEIHQSLRASLRCPASIYR